MQIRIAPYGYMLITAVALFCCSSTLRAQFAKSPHVIRDPRLDLLVDKQIELNQQALKARTTVVQGFRILVISTNKRDLALEARSNLLKNYPEHKSYMYYQSPHFKIQFGNFRTQKEAEQMKKNLEALFGEGLLIVPAKVEVKGEAAEGETI